MRHLLLKEETELTIPKSIASSFLLAPLPHEAQEGAYLALSPIIEHFEKGAVLMSAGDVTERRLAFVASGAVIVYREKEHRTPLSKISAGGSFGAATLFSAEPISPSEIVALTKGVSISFSRESIRTHFLKYPETALAYICFLTDRVGFLNRRIRDFSYGSATEKTARLLLANSDEAGTVDIPNLRAASDSMKLSRASLYRVLSVFADDELIRKDGKQINILNFNALKGLLK